MNGSKKQCHREFVHGDHGWFLGRDWYTCPGIESEFDNQWISDKSYTGREHGWPTFEVQVVVNADTSAHLLLVCRSCDWEKRFSWPELWSVLSSNVSRHGMTHIEEEQG